MNPDDLARWIARSKDTKARFGMELPIVDYEDPALAWKVPDEDRLALFVVEMCKDELTPFEIIIEAAAPPDFTVLYAGKTHPPGRRFIEYRLAIRIADQGNVTVHRIISKTKVTDRNDLVLITTPRWVYRAAHDRG